MSHSVVAAKVLLANSVSIFLTVQLTPSDWRSDFGDSLGPAKVESTGHGSTVRGGWDFSGGSWDLSLVDAEDGFLLHAPSVSTVGIAGAVVGGGRGLAVTRDQVGVVVSVSAQRLSPPSESVLVETLLRNEVVFFSFFQ